MSVVTMIFVGGFLGAGKTTLLGRAARRLVERGRRVGLITNDQAPDLVDTARLMGEGYTVGEVAGSCFCCDFNGLVRVSDQVIGKVRPDVILSEPVGSCTDISATVLQPFKRLLSDRYRLAPFTVMADPLRLRDALLGPASGGFPESVTYIFKTQLEEADLVVLNKIDAVAPDQLQAIERDFVRQFPGKPLLRMAARAGEGVDAWLEYVLTETAAGRTIARVDYDVYAAGEAALGWLNAAADLETSESIDWRRFCIECTRRMQATMSNLHAEIAHLKIRIETRHGAVQANLTRTEGAPAVEDQRSVPRTPSDAPLLDARQQQGFSAEPQVDRAVLLVNARVHIEPDVLRNIVLQAVHGTAGDAVEVQVTRLASFKPNRPNPTHRMPDVAG